jgi:hypothetical protein
MNFFVRSEIRQWIYGQGAFLCSSERRMHSTWVERRGFWQGEVWLMMSIGYVMPFVLNEKNPEIRQV